MTGWRQINDDPPPVAHTAPADPPGPAPRATDLHEAADRYRAATDDYHEAAAHAIATRRDGFTRDAHKANAAARDARKAWETARDELVAAALEHECEAG